MDYSQPVLTWGNSGKGYIVPPNITPEENAKRKKELSELVTELYMKTVRRQLNIPDNVRVRWHFIEGITEAHFSNNQSIVV